MRTITQSCDCRSRKRASGFRRLKPQESTNLIALRMLPQRAIPPAPLAVACAFPTTDTAPVPTGSHGTCCPGHIHCRWNTAKQHWKCRPFPIEIKLRLMLECRVHLQPPHAFLNGPNTLDRRRRPFQGVVKCVGGVLHFRFSFARIAGWS